MSSQYRRHLGRNSAHRLATLRNLVTSLVQHESISTTYAKAKEAQRVAEKLITLGKRNTEAAKTRAHDYLFEPHKWIPKVFGTLAIRYKERPGGYTRILQCEPLKDDQAKSAVLSLVDGPKDMRFNMTARALIRQTKEKLPMNAITATNVRKVTRFRKDGVNELMAEVNRVRSAAGEREKMEKKMFEEDGTRFKWTTELPRSDPRWIEKRGPGRLVRRRIGPKDDEEPETNVKGAVG